MTTTDTPQDKEGLREKLLETVDGFRFDQNWTSSQADDFPDHKGAGCGCGVCQKMHGLNSSAVDAILDAVIASLPEPLQHMGKRTHYDLGYNDAIKFTKATLQKAKQQKGVE